MLARPQPANDRSNFWVFTLCNPVVDLDNHPRDLFPGAVYSVYQLEQSESGMFHFQGYVVFSNRPRFGAVCEMLPNAHFERRRGNHAQAKEYCMKVDTRVDGPWEFGDDSRVASGPGQRQDLDGFRDAVRSGARDHELLDSHLEQMARYPRLATTVRLSMPAPRRRGVSVRLFWGVAGTGKTRFAYEQYPDLYMVPLQQSRSLWFDGYQGEEVILLDEFSGQMALDSLLRLLDEHPCQVPVKGGYVALRNSVFVITSNSHWTAWYDFSKRPEKRAALERRIEQEVKFEELHGGHRLPQRMIYRDGALVPDTAPAVQMDFSVSDDMLV